MLRDLLDWLAPKGPGAPEPSSGSVPPMPEPPAPKPYPGANTTFFDGLTASWTVPDNVSVDALALIKSYESLRLSAYKPTPNDVWTIGWGHTKGVAKGDTCTVSEADQWLIEDYLEAKGYLDRLNCPVSLSRDFEGALVSLLFNCGPSVVAMGSTVGTALRAGNLWGAWAGMALWRKQAGVDMLGLARRRAAEMSLAIKNGGLTK